jgi:hypothetical protein
MKKLAVVMTLLLSAIACMTPSQPGGSGGITPAIQVEVGREFDIAVGQEATVSRGNKRFTLPVECSVRMGRKRRRWIRSPWGGDVRCFAQYDARAKISAIWGIYDKPRRSQADTQVGLDYSCARIRCHAARELASTAVQTFQPVGLSYPATPNQPKISHVKFKIDTQGARCGSSPDSAWKGVSAAK